MKRTLSTVTQEWMVDELLLDSHPTYGTPQLLNNLWDGRLILPSTEMSAANGGLLEGALEGAEKAFRRIQQR